MDDEALSRALLADPCGRALPPVERALSTFATRLSQAPWEVTAADVGALSAVGLSDETIVHVVVQSAFFNYLNRVADAVGIDFDYESALPRLDKDATREPWPRPGREAWPAGPVTSLSLASRPPTAEALARWRAYLMDRDAPLSRHERRVIAGAVAVALCDASVDAEAAAGARDEALAGYATTLTAVPWQLTEDSLAPLRALGLDDRALLDVIAVAAYQNAASRITRVVGT